MSENSHGKLIGSYTVSVTPFTADGSGIDYEAWQRFLDWQLRAGVPGIIILGTTGEFLTISDTERRVFVKATIDHIGGRIPVVVSTMNAYTPTAVRYSKEAEDLGASGLMIIPPYYYTPTDDEVFEYYRAISAAVTIPIMLYNNPVTSNKDMSAALVARLTRAFENVRYIKEASQDLARVSEIVEATGGVMNVFAGERVVDSFLLGAVGYVNPYGNYIPFATSRIWDYLVEGRIDDARAIQRIVSKMDHIIAEGHPTYGHQCYSKALAAAVGYPVGDVRPPLTTFAALGDEGRRRVKLLTGLIAELDTLMETLEAKPSGQALAQPAAIESPTFT
jgi:4-hydroxy-tetrahydrodipicolinate synthase